MAINFLNSIDFNKNELFNPKIQNEINDSAAGTPVDGQLYYNTTDNKLKVGEGGSWVALSSSADTNTTYDLTATGASNGSATVNLVASNPSSTDSILFTGAGTTSVTRSGTTITITSNDQFDGTVTSVGCTINGDAYTASVASSTTAAAITIAPQGSSSQYIDGAGDLQTFPSIPQGDITNVGVTAPITGGGSSGSVTIGHASQSDTASAASASLSFGGTFDAYTDVTTNSTGHVTGHEVTTFTLPANPNVNTTYTLGVETEGANTAGIKLIPNSGAASAVVVSGTAATIKVTENTATDIITLDLQDDVTIASDLTVGDNLTLTGGNLSVTGTGSFTGQVTIPVTPTATDSAASKSYVDSTLAGSGALIFQGGYDAANNTPDLDSNPSASIKQGWTYAVTTAGSFFTETVEDGDLLIAESDSPTSLSDWTVVQNNIGIATANTTDNNTTKGIAGFNSAHFNVTTNGWVSSDIYAGASTLGIVPSGGSSSTFLRGDGTWVTPTDSTPVDSVQLGTAGTSTGLTNAIEVTPTTGNVKVIANSYDGGNNVGYVPSGGSSSTFLRGDGTWVTPTDSTPVDSVSAISPGSSTGTPIVITPTTGTVTVQSMAYSGSTKVGHVPSGGSGTTFLRGDGSWVVPSTGDNNFVSGLSFNTGNGIITATRSGLSSLTVDLDGRYALSSAIPTITAQGDAIFLTSGSTSGGITTFDYDVTNSFSGADAIDVKCEIVSAAGETVYAAITRSSSTLTVKFSGTVADSDYKALLTYVG